jgi:nitroreductase
LVEVLEAIRTRRSVRSFKDEKISDEDAAKILEAARWAPSAGNKQPWTFIYVKDPQVLDRKSVV